jgi:hypothetical protein
MMHGKARLLLLLVAAACLAAIPCAIHAQSELFRSPAATDPVYAARELTVSMDPPIPGYPMAFCVTLQNPTGTDQTLTVKYSFGDFGIGMPFNQITQKSVFVPAGGTVQKCINWVPAASGPYCYQVGVTLPGHDEIFVWRNIDAYEPLMPFVPDTLEFPVRNNTASTATVTLGLVPHLPGWGFELSQDVIPNLAPGAQQMVLLISTPPLDLPEGRTPIVDVEAYIGGELLGGFRKSYPAVETCDGARVELAPPILPVNGSAGFEERGAFITPIREFEACALGMEVNLAVPQIVTARVYEANGTTRGALIAEGEAWAILPGTAVHYVPLGIVLHACQDYDVSFEYGAASDFYYIDETAGFEPYDAGGAIRVRDGELAGNASSPALPRLALLGYAPGGHDITECSPAGASWGLCNDGSTERGAYVRPHRTITVSSIEFESDFGGDVALLRACIYEGTAKARGPLLATGTATVTSTGLEFHAIPISAVLEEGKEYDLSIEFPAATWGCIDESQIALPFMAGGVLEVEDGEQGGNAANTILPHLAVEWSEGMGGTPYILSKATEEPFNSTESNDTYGLYLTSLLPQEIYSVGWNADVTPGTVLHAWVYEASGTSRGALISEGSIVAVEGGMRWHDIPVSASLQSGADYNVEIGFGPINVWPFWEDFSGMPYVPYGLFEVFATSHAGSPAGHRIVDMRVNGCNHTATGVDSRGDVPLPFTLEAPYPNPISANASIGYSIELAGPVTIAVYDVAGRRVATLLERAVRPAGRGSIELDTRKLAPGVYFVKMEMAAKSVSRKIAIVR